MTPAQVAAVAHSRCYRDASAALGREPLLAAFPANLRWERRHAANRCAIRLGAGCWICVRAAALGCACPVCGPWDADGFPIHPGSEGEGGDE